MSPGLRRGIVCRISGTKQSRGIRAEWNLLRVFVPPWFNSTQPMNADWTDRLLELVRAFDVREAPHGLYGALPEYANEGRLPSLAYVLALPQAEVLREIGGNCHSRRGNSNVRMQVGGTWCDLTVLDHAATMVRRFGSTYRLDSHDSKPPCAPACTIAQWYPRFD